MIMINHAAAQWAKHKPFSVPLTQKLHQNKGIKFYDLVYKQECDLF